MAAHLGAAMTDEPSVFDRAPRQSDFGVNDKGLPYNDVMEALKKGRDELPGFKQFKVGTETVDAVEKLFDGQVTGEEVFTAIDTGLSAVVAYIEAVELIITGAQSAALKDPIGLVGAAVGAFVAAGGTFIIEHVQPVQDLMGVLKGNPGRIKKSAEMWKALAEGIKPVGEDLHASATTVKDSWTGKDGSAAHQRLLEGGDAVAVSALMAKGISVALGYTAALYEKIQGFLVNRAADLAGALVSNIPDLAKGPVGWLEILADLTPILLRIQLELVQIGLHVTRVLGALAGLFDAATNASEKMKPYIEKMSH
jgi:hypothetical protein